MIIEVERYVKFITNNKITQAQFLFLYLLYRKRYDLLKDYKNTFPSDDGTVIGKIARNDLLERKFIIKLDEEEKATSYAIGSEFKKIFVDAFEATDELKSKYPAFITNNGVNYPLTLVDTYQLANIYGQRIGYEIAEHEEVLKDLQYGIDNNLIKGKLELFVRSEFWKPLRELRLGTNTKIIEGEIENSQIFD